MPIAKPAYDYRQFHYSVAKKQESDKKKEEAKQAEEVTLPQSVSKQNEADQEQKQVPYTGPGDYRQFHYSVAKEQAAREAKEEEELEDQYKFPS